MFVRIVPLKRMGSWGMIESRDRRIFKEILPMSRPSILMQPQAGSTSRNRHSIILLFPDPVRPTTPTTSPPSTFMETWRSSHNICCHWDISGPAAEARFGSLLDNLERRKWSAGHCRSLLPSIRHTEFDNLDIAIIQTGMSSQEDI